MSSPESTSAKRPHVTLLSGYCRLCHHAIYQEQEPSRPLEPSLESRASIQTVESNTPPRITPSPSPSPFLPLYDWRSKVVPGPPPSTAAYPEDWNKLEFLKGQNIGGLDDMGTQTEDQASRTTKASTKDPYGSNNYKKGLLINRIYEQMHDEKDYQYKDLVTPPWGAALLSYIQQPLEYPLTRRLLDIMVDEHMNGFKISSAQQEHSFETSIIGRQPMTPSTFRSFYRLTIDDECPSGSDLHHASRIGNGRRGDPKFQQHLGLFPYPELLRCTKPDVTVGYSDKWVRDIITPDYPGLVQVLQNDYEVTSEGILFPYLFVEFKSVSNGSVFAARHQLQTCIATSLSATRDIVKGNMAVFALVIHTEYAELSLVWMTGPPAKPSFVFGKPIPFPITYRENFIKLQDILMRIHIWANTERKETFKQYLLDEAKSRVEQYPPLGLPPIFTLESNSPSNEREEGIEDMED
ncbi:hypothetical protein F4805DRAFT_103024 [Annulohypoxylon moriforme]|nr:hypothetical protein F4805DRAFT_103024 [Annulohypoxylon moriforme]